MQKDDKYEIHVHFQECIYDWQANYLDSGRSIIAEDSCHLLGQNNSITLTFAEWFPPKLKTIRFRCS